MHRVKILPPEISVKIASGEVVERPYSVVKELVENSIDANSKRIEIYLEKAGKRLIRVVDDGYGIKREDVPLCFERHSTSKIESEEDLFRISTLGFRGEALPSISGVSRLILKTRADDEETGTLIEREGNETIQILEIPYPKGTMVEVRDLFFNLPVRLKFLRSDEREFKIIYQYIAHLSLAHLSISFLLFHNGRELLNLPECKSIEERISEIYGATFLESLMPFSSVIRNFIVEGLISKSGKGMKSRDYQAILINGRLTKERSLLHAIHEAYRGNLEKDYFPSFFLSLKIPFDQLDVNFHPSKEEVKLRSPSEFYREFLEKIRESLRGRGTIYSIETQAPSFIEEGEEEFLKTTEFQPPLFDKTYTEKIRILGQFQESFIIAEKEDAILIIDQHNAHEKILFEEYKREKTFPKVSPVFPIILELPHSMLENLAKRIEILEEIGFEFEIFGVREIKISHYPAIIPENILKETFIWLIEDEEIEFEEERKRILSKIACKTAIKINQRLSPQEMAFIVDRLFKTEDPKFCPHGRPVFIEITKIEIERGLKRK
ncbi:MAG: DNA mismatch repair endonuclease MutL [Candidatus Aminicenantia bacterium]